MKNILFLFSFLIAAFLFSCQKTELKDDSLPQKKFKLSSAISSISDPSFENHDDDSIERQTILGSQLANPYLIPNMQQAYSNLGITNVLLMSLIYM